MYTYSTHSSLGCFHFMLLVLHYFSEGNILLCLFYSNNYKLIFYIKTGKPVNFKALKKLQ